MLALGTPDEVRRQAGQQSEKDAERPDMEEAFIAIVEKARAGENGSRSRRCRHERPAVNDERLGWFLAPPLRPREKEVRQMVRDRSNLAIGIGLPIVLILFSATACRST